MPLVDLKWYRKIRAEREQTAFTAPQSPIPFNLEALNAGPGGSIREQLASWIKGLFVKAVLGVGVWVARLTGWRVRVGNVLLVTGRQDVRKVLHEPKVFMVPYGPEMKELGGDQFVLGVDGPLHTCLRNLIDPALNGGDPNATGKIARRTAQVLVDSSYGRIDVMKDLITRVAAETCLATFGLDVVDPDQFADWTLAISDVLFADPTGSAVSRQLALEAGARLRDVAMRATRDARERSHKNEPRDAVIDRLVATPLKDPEICATIVGLTAGFVPTTTLAAANILLQLLGDDGAWDQTVAAASRYNRLRAQADDFGSPKDLELAASARWELDACLWEAARLRPALSNGQFRYARAEDTRIDPQTDIPGEPPKKKREVFRFDSGGLWSRVFEGDVVVADTAGAVMRLGRRFNPKRWRRGQDLPGEMVFGSGSHFCLGQKLALSVAAEIFGVLLSRPDLKKAKGKDGKLQTVGPFPRQLWMTFRPPVTHYGLSMMSICVPLKADTELDPLQKYIRTTLGHPATDSVADMLDATNIVHFASLSVIDAGEPGAPQPYFVLELNADGRPDDLIVRVVEKAGAALRPVFAHARDVPPEHDPDDHELIDLLAKYQLDLKTRAWPKAGRATGLNFSGVSENSVVDIELQDRLAQFTEAALQHHHHNSPFMASPMAAIARIRRILRNDDDPAWAATDLSPYFHDRQRLAEALIRPSRQRPIFTAWTEPDNLTAALQVAKAHPGFWVVLILVHAFIAVVVLSVLSPPSLQFAPLDWPTLSGLAKFAWLTVVDAVGIVRWVAAGLLALTGSVFGMLALEGAVIWLLLVILRAKENADISDDRAPSREKVEQISTIENHPRFAQNHFMAVTTLKPGAFRRGALAFALWGVKQLVKYWFRPGFVASLGTIHYAKWFVLPGTQKEIFQANYDGSWESYLEDFIMRAHQGQSAVWSNSLGFPDTRYLVLDGALNGDRFKRYVRRHQAPTQFWYSRFPRLTTNRVRNNALIHDGLIHAVTDTDARAWLSCFGSMPRPKFAIEGAEVQSLVFRGMSEMPVARVALICLPNDTKQREAWLSALAHEHPDDTACGLQFGDLRPSKDQRTAACVAFSKVGLEKLGLPEQDGEPGLATFAAPFTLGMKKRQAVLGDPSGKAHWRWSDDEYDAALVVFGKKAGDCDAALDAHLGLLGVTAKVIETRPAWSDRPNSVEHFGFRDGISQPVIQGTRRAAAGAPKSDLVAPGEFLFGYRSNDDYFPLSPFVDVVTDTKDLLPTPAAQVQDRFPAFGDAGPTPSVRDFGRNGTFMVIRQLEQHVDLFNRDTAQCATQLQARYPRLSDVVGEPITAEWVASKIIGRRKDGEPLVDAASASPFAKQSPDAGDETDSRPENDFYFGEDDPQGLRCPFGAHVRRTNPRDSLVPGDELEVKISNRHRLLRRGRSYKDGDEKGLVFICLCADLERQYEFVQQTWVNSPNFHGLSREPDPMLGPLNCEPRRFTIPTTAGPVIADGLGPFVTLRGGGYFFMPSRAAISYLAALQTRAGERAINASQPVEETVADRPIPNLRSGSLPLAPEP